MRFSVCRLDELTPHKLKVFEIDDIEVVLVCTEQRDVFAFENKCSHADKPLIKGKWNETTCEITCPFHKAVFSLREQGAVKVGPACLPIETYVVEIENEQVFVTF